MKIFLSQSGGDQVNLLQANLNAVYLSLAFIAVPSFIICFSLVFKKQLSKQATNLLYAFTIGFFLMTGFFELFEGIETALENYKDGVFLKLLSNVGTAILVLGIVIFFKFFVKFKFNHKLS